MSVQRRHQNPYPLAEQPNPAIHVPTPMNRRPAENLNTITPSGIEVNRSAIWWAGLAAGDPDFDFEDYGFESDLLVDPVGHRVGR
jgi:hypothetical protein